jgi:hypothetical protein
MEVEASGHLRGDDGFDGGRQLKSIKKSLLHFLHGVGVAGGLHLHRGHGGNDLDSGQQLHSLRDSRVLIGVEDPGRPRRSSSHPPFLTSDTTITVLVTGEGLESEMEGGEATQEGQKSAW